MKYRLCFLTLLVWGACMNVFSAVSATGYTITKNTSSTLTGEKGVTCIECTAANNASLQAAWEEAGKPSKLKIKGPMSGLGYMYEGMRTTITYLDLSEATIVAGGYNSDQPNWLDRQQLGDFYGQESSDECGIRILVLPDGLTRFTFSALGQYSGPTIFPFTDIYTNNMVPFDVNCGGKNNTLFHVPQGTKAIWQEKISGMIVCDTPAKTVTTTQGNLAGQMTAQEMQTVDVLTINGEINAKDFAFLSQMSDLTKLVINASIKGYYGSDGPDTSTMIYAENSIPAYTFTGNTMLRQVIFPSGYSISVGDYAFDGCTSLTHLGYYSDWRVNGSQGGVSGKIGDFAFRNTKLGYVMVKSSVNEIGKNPFFGTPALSTERYAHYDYDYDEGYDHYDLTNFSLVESGSYSTYSHQLILSKDNRTLYASHWSNSYNTTALTIPASVVEVKDYALSDICVTTVTLNSNLQKLGDGFLYKCKKLSSISATGNYTSEDGVLFAADMKTLVKYPCAKTNEEYTIPATVSTISKWAFEGAANLKTINALSGTPAALGEMVFEDVDLEQVVLSVPKGSKAAYQTAEGWKSFKNIVEAGAQVEQTLELSELPAMTYGDAAYTLPGTTAEGQPLTWTSGNSAIAAVSGSQLTIKKAGTVTITATQEGNDDYLPFTREYSLTIAKAPLKITADNQTKQESEANPELTVSYVGFKYSDTALSLTKQPTVTTTATTSSAAGEYPISVSGAQSDNYSISYVNGTLTVTEAEQQLEVTDISKLEDAIYIEPMEGFAGSEIDIEVKLKNTLTPVGCSFRLALPEGLQLVKDEDGDVIYTMGNRAKKMSLTMTDWKNGSYDFALTPSSSSATISGNSGDIFIIFKVQLPDDMSAGDYNLQLTRCLIQSKTEGMTKDVKLSDVVTKLTVNDYMIGDANGDKNVTPSDAIMTLYYYFNVEQTGFNVKAADVNNDGNVTPADAIEILYMYFGTGSQTRARHTAPILDPQ